MGLSVVNALIHQDFTASEMPVMVEFYSDRMENSNPGTKYLGPA